MNLLTSGSLISQTISEIKDPGRLYRPLFCPDCESIRYHRIDFIAAERNEKGVFVWFNRRCSGVNATDKGRNRLQRAIKGCGREREDSIPYIQWQPLVDGEYY